MALKNNNDTCKPETWLADYLLACCIGGGNDRVAMHNLPLMLEGSARAWLNSLPENSIHVWEDLEDTFVRNFQGTYKRPGSVQVLWMSVQKSGESVRDYIQRWTQLRNLIENITETETIQSIKQGVKYEHLRLNLDRTEIRSMGRLMEIVKKYVTREESVAYELRTGKSKASKDRPQDHSDSGNNNNNNRNHDRDRG